MYSCVLGASGVTITSADVHEPGTGHHHIFVDRDLTPLDDTIPAGVPGIIHMGRGQTEFSRGRVGAQRAPADRGYCRVDPRAPEPARRRHRPVYCGATSRARWELEATPRKPAASASA